LAYAYARFIHRFRWLLIGLWVIATVAATVWLPNLTSVVATQKANYLPATSSVNVAQDWLNQINPQHSSASTAVIAYHRTGGLTAADNRYFQTVLAQFSQHKTVYGIQSVQDPFNVPSAVASSFSSQDRTTEIALIGFPQADMASATSHSVAQLKAAFSAVPAGARLYFTGDAPIQQDEMSISQAGVAKTGIVTYVLVLLILLIVFRLLLAPLLPLMAIGISFMISSGIVAWLAQRGLPSSTFTQTFLIAILFGAGTDYSIILLNRFREELTKSADVVTALAHSLRAVSKTVAFSAATVFVSFAVLFFTQFGLYRSAVGVSIGVAVALMACLTFLPALMSLFGRSLYWPMRPVHGAGHKPSRIWRSTGALATYKPWWTLLALIVVLAPIGALFTDLRTFDPLSDIPSAPSANGFQVISQAFGPGHALPMQLVMHSSADLRSSAGLATIQQISAATAKLSSVDEVMSATQPAGKPIAAFTLANQNQQAASGLGQIDSGLGSLANHLTTTGHAISAGAGKATALTSGANQVAGGVAQISSGNATLAKQTSLFAKGAKQWQQGASGLAAGLAKLTSGVANVAHGSKELTAGLKQTTQGVNSASSGASQLTAAQRKMAQAASQLVSVLAAWSKSHPQSGTDPQWQQIEALAGAESQGAAQLTVASERLANGASTLAGGLPTLTPVSGQLSTGLHNLGQGAAGSQSGAGKLATGASQLANGAAQLASGNAKLATAATQLASGSHQVARGVGAINGELGQLASGFTAFGNGATKLQTGTSSVHQFLTGTNISTVHGNPGFYIPASQVKSNASLQKAMNAYISADGHTAEWTVILKQNPFSMRAIDAMPLLIQTARSALSGSPIHTGTILAGGTTPTQAALNAISTSDFMRAMVLILSAIFLLLVFMLRSLITPLYILASLGGTYFITMGLLQVITVDVLHKTGLSWTVPFFAFLLLVALGVDYSIFLFSRFEEELHGGLRPAEAMHKAMGHMGNVIFSAAVIMAGTFGSMTISGVTSLVEIGLAVVIGLLLYTTVILGLFIPSATAIVDRGHFWPFGAGARETGRTRELTEPGPPVLDA